METHTGNSLGGFSVLRSYAESNMRLNQEPNNIVLSNDEMNMKYMYFNITQMLFMINMYTLKWYFYICRSAYTWSTYRNHKHYSTVKPYNNKFVNYYHYQVWHTVHNCMCSMFKRLLAQ